MKYLVFISISLFLFFLIIFLHPWQSIPSESFITIGNKNVMVEIAKTPEELTLGLSYRKSLEKDHGMLFVFPQKSLQTFWMKEMDFNLDFIWIDGDKVIDITENVNKPIMNTPNNLLDTYKSKFPVTSMLEVNSGFAKENKIHIGDPVVLHQ